MAEDAEPNVAAPSAAEAERRVRAYWTEFAIPRRAAEGRPDGEPFRFTEGPPTANGRPHVGHLVGRVVKDAELRYRRMRGHRIVTPMAGWDCHGLPVELEIEKRHGIRSKKEIEAFGVERFCEECRAGALEVAQVWREMSEGLGYWLDYDRPYYTMSPSYMESVWWSLKTLFDRGLLEKGRYVLPYCPRCETPLSSHEVAQGYRETTDPSVTVRFPLSDAPDGVPRRLLVWTTTPWTLPANLLVAARADLAYVAVRAEDGGEEILAEAALTRYRPAGAEVVERWTGRDLAGRLYTPPFEFAGAGPNRYRVVLDDMVDAAEGTGFVHIAPSFGPEDQRVGEREKVGHFDPLDGRGVFTAAVPPVAGTAFKAADPILVADLERRGLLAAQGTLRHTYPFCWRCSTALIYRAVDSWFVRTSRFTEALVRNNAQVDWVPGHLRDGRMGNFLTEAKDWALSRARYWGTPLPIWVCPKGHPTCVGSFRELADRVGAPLPVPFDPHRVTVDRLEFPCPSCGERARREPYTIDGWYDSGSAPFAQYHYPFEPGPFDPARPLDFIAEGLDQTRGWFYTLLVLATLLFDRPAYRACVVNGLVLDERGLKMSKSKGNVLDPLDLLGRYGADAVRWTFLLVDFTEPLKASETAIQKGGARVVSTLLNVVEFYRANALADGLSASSHRPEVASLLDRWLLSRADGTVARSTAALDAHDPRSVALVLRELVDDLSTWYLRRSRPRFWSEGEPSDRRSANATLSYVLLRLARLLAPVAPYTAEFVHQEVGGHGYRGAETSVHLAAWPERDGSHDLALESSMAALREEVELGRELRQRVQVKSRIPLATFVRFSEAPSPAETLGAEGDRLLAEELNVREVIRARPGEVDRYRAEGFEVREDDGRPSAALSRAPTPELLAEGMLREALRRLQLTRKELRLHYTDRVNVKLHADDALFDMLERGRDRLREELLADVLEVRRGPPERSDDYRSWELGAGTLYARVEPVRPPG